MRDHREGALAPRVDSFKYFDDGKLFPLFFRGVFLDYGTETPERVHAELLKNNANFVEEMASDPKELAKWNSTKSTVVGCFDSGTVPCEMVKQYIKSRTMPAGMLTKPTRLAIIDDIHFVDGKNAGVLVIVLGGHTGCTAMGEAYDWLKYGKKVKDEYVDSMLDQLTPAVGEALRRLREGRIQPEHLVDASGRKLTKEHVLHLVRLSDSMPASACTRQSGRRGRGKELARSDLFYLIDGYRGGLPSRGARMQESQLEDARRVSEFLAQTLEMKWQNGDELTTREIETFVLLALNAPEVKLIDRGALREVGTCGALNAIDNAAKDAASEINSLGQVHRFMQEPKVQGFIDAGGIVAQGFYNTRAEKYLPLNGNSGLTVEMGELKFLTLFANESGGSPEAKAALEELRAGNKNVRRAHHEDLKEISGGRRVRAVIIIQTESKIPAHVLTRSTIKDGIMVLTLPGGIPDKTALAGIRFAVDHGAKDIWVMGGSPHSLLVDVAYDQLVNNTMVTDAAMREAIRPVEARVRATLAESAGKTRTEEELKRGINRDIVKDTADILLNMFHENVAAGALYISGMQFNDGTTPRLLAKGTLAPGQVREDFVIHKENIDAWLKQYEPPEAKLKKAEVMNKRLIRVK